jgi:ubiquinone/menaquinone biosynthesis C-methylase UbiE
MEKKKKLLAIRLNKLNYAFFEKIRNFLYEKDVIDVDVNSKKLAKINSNILKKKLLLKSAYKTFYKDMALVCDNYFIKKGLEIELGSGTGFFKKIRKKVITSDIRLGLRYNIRIDAMNMKLKKNSVKCIYAINVFHHIANPNKFFNELIRVLKKDGGCILIEPHNGFLSRMLHSYSCKEEYFDTRAKEWVAKKTVGPLSNANQALSYNIFERDENKFKKKYGKNLKIIHKQYEINGLRFIFSGGLNFKQLVPNFFLPLLFVIEFFLFPFAKFWTPYRMIVLKKVK